MMGMHKHSKGPRAQVPSPYGEWRLHAYRTATLMWAAFLLFAYTTTLYRMPMALSAQVLLLSSLHLLTCLTLGAAVWGSTAYLRAFTTTLMVTRSIGYIGIGMGWIPINFKRQAFSFSANSSDFPLATFGFMAALLFDTVGLVHVHVPRLQLLLQTLASIISSLSVGTGVMTSVIKSVAVHGLCGLIYIMLEHRDLRCYAALLEAQKPGDEHKVLQGKLQALEAQGSSSMAAADGATRVSSKAQSAKSGGEDPHGAFQGLQDALLMRSSEPSGPSSDAVLSSAEVAAVLAPDAHLAAPPERHTMPTDAANSLPSFPAPMLRSLTSMPAPSKPWVPHPASLDELYHALQQRFVGPEGEARLQALRSITASTKSKGCVRHRYKKQQRRHLAVMKVPGSVHPENLPASALPSLASLINARNPEYTMGDVAMRCGCILLTMDIQEELQKKLAVESPGTQDSVAHKLAASARLWLQETQLADQLPASVPVLLQVNGTVLQMVREPGTSSWSITDFSSAAPPSSEYSITAASPAALLPTQQQQQQQQHVQSCSEECTLQLRAHVRMPAGFGVVGWDGTSSAQSTPAAHNSSDKGSEDLQVLASLGGSGYLCTRVDAVTKSDGGDLTELQVRVSLPAGQAASTCPCTLALELWQQHTLHSSSTLLLLPASLQGAAAELQLLPWAEEDVAEYVHDLGKWLHLHTPPCLSATSAQLHSCPSAWETGQLLLRQAVLWGLPAVSTLLLESLMALPSAPAMPFTHTAHAPASTPAAHLPPPEELGLDDLGGLLHLALLCPDSSSMLAAVLDWGRRWGAREPGFAWRWCEHNKAGFSPLDTLATLPRSSKTLLLVLTDPEQGRSVLGAALARAQGGTPNVDAGSGACDAPHARAVGSAVTQPVSQQPPSVPGEAAGRSYERGLAAQAAASVAALSAGLISGAFAPKASHAVQLAGSAAGRVWAAVVALGSKGVGLWKSLLGVGRKEGSSSSSSSDDAGSSSSSSMNAKARSHDEGRAADFRRWANMQAASIAQKWCTYYFLHLVAAILRNAWASGWLEANYNLVPLAMAYGMGCLALPSYPQHSEVFLLIIIISRTSWLAAAGMGWFPLGNSAAHMINIRAEYPLEILLMSTLEHVRFTWMLAMRPLMFIAYVMVYRTCGRLHPFIEAATVNLGSLAVTRVMEGRMHKLFLCHKNRQKRKSGEAVSSPEAQQLKTD